MLFSLYEEPDKMAMYLPQVFPDNVRVWATEKAADPKFFSFMSVDINGFNQYNHCLIFYEKFTVESIHEDFDINVHIEKLIRKKARLAKKQQYGTEEHVSFGQKGDHKKAKQRNIMAPNQMQQMTSQDRSREPQETEPIHELAVDKAMQIRATQKSNIWRSKTQNDSQIDGARFRTSEKGKAQGFVPVQNNGVNLNGNGLVSVQETAEEHFTASQTTQHMLGTQDENEESKYRDSLFGKTRQEAQTNGGNQSSFYAKGQSISKSHVNQKQENGDDLVNTISSQEELNNKMAQEQTSKVKFDDASTQAKSIMTDGISKTDKNFKLGVNQQYSASQPTSSRSSMIGNSEVCKKADCYYVPIAFVIQTEVEHHDIFKEVLLRLFESIRQPAQVTQDYMKNRFLAFADFLCHIAFLISIPCPTFNTRYHIEFFGKTLQLKEPNYDEIPDKNELSIRLMFDMLDVKTIMYCWKAILFDHTLVLISSQYSLQFYIAQALLQLVFPLTFQYSYVQPASSARIGMVQSPFPILFACSHLVQDFEYFESLQKSNIAIVDIDGCFTNNLEFPELEDEKMILRSLSALKNFKGAKFDSLFQEIHHEEMKISDMTFTIEVRKVFFNMLDQFLSTLLDGSCFKALQPGEDLAFINYFDEAEYLAWWEGTKNLKFAEQLMNSQLFATFCDDYFDKDVSNFLIYINYSRNGFDFDQDPKMSAMFEERMEQLALKVKDEQEKQQRSNILKGSFANLPQRNAPEKLEETKKASRSKTEKPISESAKIREWPKNKKIDICWRIPQDNQRVMIFEKLEYAIRGYENEVAQLKKYQDNKKDGEKDQKKKQLHDQQIQRLIWTINEIKNLFSQKLPIYGNQLKIAQKTLRTLPCGLDGLDIDSNKGEEVFDKGEVNFETNNGTMKPPQMDDFSGQIKIPLMSMESESGLIADLGSKTMARQVSDPPNNSNRDGLMYDVTPKQKFKAATQFPDQQFESSDMYKSSLEQAIPIAKQIEFNQLQNDKNRIVEMCYGTFGLLDFLDLMFEQFETRRQVRNKFNYYFTIRKQIQAIETQINEELHKSAKLSPAYDAWFTQHSDLLSMLVPQRKASMTQSSSALPQPQNDPKQVSKYPQPQLQTACSIVFKGCAGVITEANSNTRDTQHRLWDMQAAQNPLEVKGGELNVFKQQEVKSDVWMLPVIPDQVEEEEGSKKYFTDLEKLVAFRTSYQYISLKQKLYFSFEDQEEAIQLIFGEFLQFSERDRQIFPKNRFFELLALMSQPQKERIFEKIVDYKSAQDSVFQLRLMFEHEVNERTADEPVSLEHLIFEEDHLVKKEKPKFNQSVRVQNVDDLTTNSQGAKNETKHKKHNSQLPDNLKNSFFCSPRGDKVKTKSPQQPQMSKNHSSDMQKLQNSSKKIHDKMQKDKMLSQTLGTTSQIKQQAATVPVTVTLLNDTRCSDESDRVNMQSFGSTQQSVKQSIAFDNDQFARAHCSNNLQKTIYNPEKKVHKLLEKILEIYMQFFDPSLFSEETKKVKKDEARISLLKESMLELRRDEFQKLSTRPLSFDQLLEIDQPEVRKEKEDIKRIFWINLFNFKMLQKVLETLLTQPSLLGKKLVNCTMFIALMQSTKIEINGSILTCYEIFKTMLRHHDVQLLTGPFEEKLRKLEDLPQALQDLAVTETHPMSSGGLYLPIKKWSKFTIFEKGKFDKQLKEVISDNIERLSICPDSFLQRIPKNFFWKTLKDDKVIMSNRFTTTMTTSTQPSDAVSILRFMIEQGVLSEDKQRKVKKVLNSIETERKCCQSSGNMVGEQTSHLFEIDNFSWRFDVLVLRKDLREYQRSRGKEVAPSVAQSLEAFQ